VFPRSVFQLLVTTKIHNRAVRLEVFTAVTIKNASSGI
jgi:hypothetical protein